MSIILKAAQEVISEYMSSPVQRKGADLLNWITGKLMNLEGDSDPLPWGGPQDYLRHGQGPSSRVLGTINKMALLLYNILTKATPIGVAGLLGFLATNAYGNIVGSAEKSLNDPATTAAINSQLDAAIKMSELLNTGLNDVEILSGDNEITRVFKGIIGSFQPRDRVEQKTKFYMQNYPDVVLRRAQFTEPEDNIYHSPNATWPKVGF